MVRIITSKQQKDYQSDPVQLRPIFKKIAVQSRPDPPKIGFSPDPCSFLAHTREELYQLEMKLCFSNSGCNFWKWVFCQEWHPGMSDYSRMVGAFQERILHWVDTLHDSFWCGKLNRQFCWWRALSVTWLGILVQWPCPLINFSLTDWIWGLKRSARHRQHTNIW